MCKMQKKKREKGIPWSPGLGPARLTSYLQATETTCKPIEQRCYLQYHLIELVLTGLFSAQLELPVCTQSLTGNCSFTGR